MSALSIEVSQSWGDSLLRVERFAASHRLRVGPSSGEFQAPLAGSVLLVDRGAVLVPGAAPLAIDAGTDVRVTLGGQTFRVRAVSPERAVPLELLRRLDWFFIGVGVAFAIFVIAVAATIVVTLFMLRVLLLLIALLLSMFGMALPPPSLHLVAVPEPPRVIAVTLVPERAPMALDSSAPVFFQRPTPQPTLAPIPLGGPGPPARAAVKIRKAERIAQQLESVEMVGVLGMLRSDDSTLSAFASLEGVEGGVEGGVVGGVMMGGLIGSDVQEGEGGLGIGGLGTRGSGISGVGTGSGQLKVSRGSVSPGEAGVAGSSAISAEVISRVVRRNLPAIRSCYESALDDAPDLAGKVVVSFAIAADGAVVETRVDSSTMRNEAVESCLLRQVRRMRFPAPRGEGVVRVNYPFRFEQS